MFRIDTKNIDLVIGQVYLLNINRWIKFKEDLEVKAPMFFTGYDGEYPCFSSVMQFSGDIGSHDAMNPMRIGKAFYDASDMVGTITVETALARKPQVAPS